jgi:hypothetical protein
MTASWLIDATDMVMLTAAAGCYIQPEKSGNKWRYCRSSAQIFSLIGRAKDVTMQGLTLTMSLLMIALAETMLKMLPHALQIRIALSPILANVAGVALIGVK